MILRKKIIIFCFMVAFFLVLSWRYFLDTEEITVNEGFSGTMVCVDGGYGFDLFTRLIDSEGNPLVNTEVTAYIDHKNAHPSGNNTNSPSCAKTDSEGNVQLTAFTGLAWGGIYRPGLELPPQPSEPYIPQVLYFWHKDTNGQWHQIQINIEDKHINRAKRSMPEIRIAQIQVNG